MEKVVRITPGGSSINGGQENNVDEQNKSTPVMRRFEQSKPKKRFPLMVVIGIFVILAGVGTGWALAGSPRERADSNEVSAPGGVTQGKDMAGVADESQFESEVEGTLRKGGMEGEGTHHLEREGGKDKSVYLVSSVLDLETFTGKKVKVWGDTIAAEKAPWLLDVGKIQVVK